MLLHHQRQDNMDFAIGTWLFICYATLILPRLLGRPWAMQPATLHTLLNKFGQGQQKKRPAAPLMLLTQGPNPKDLLSTLYIIKAKCRACVFREQWIFFYTKVTWWKPAFWECCRLGEKFLWKRVFLHI